MIPDIDKYRLDGEYMVALIFSWILLNLAVDDRNLGIWHRPAVLCHNVNFVYKMSQYICLAMVVKNKGLYLDKLREYILLPIIHILIFNITHTHPILYIVPHVLISELYFKYHENILDDVNTMVAANNME